MFWEKQFSKTVSNLSILVVGILPSVAYLNIIWSFCWFFSFILVITFQEKRDKEMAKAKKEGALEGLSKEDITKKRATIPPVPNQQIQVPDSDDEEYKNDLLCRRWLFLKKARSVASNRRAKGRTLLEALERPGSSQLHVSELLKLAEANVPIPPAHNQGVLPTPPDKIFIPESPLSTQGSGY